ncbi:hypothetical protein Goklo_002587, partial [Gossypium klotzschianum]|nr:hypothetical protein [Gossypium klotzschianum]
NSLPDNKEYNDKFVASHEGSTNLRSRRKTILVHIFHKMDLEKVQSGSPWTFNSQLLVLHCMVEGEDPLKDGVRNRYSGNEMGFVYTYSIKESSSNEHYLAKRRRGKVCGGSMSKKVNLVLRVNLEGESNGGLGQIEMEHDSEEYPLEGVKGKNDHDGNEFFD